MKNKKPVRIILMVLAALICIGSMGYANSNARRKAALKKKIYDASQKTIQHYYDTYEPREFAGLMDWPALGLYGFGEDISGPVWTVNGKNAAYWREEQVKAKEGLSETKNTDYQRTLIGIVSANRDPRNFGGIDFVKTVKETMLPNGHFADSVKDTRTKVPIGDDLINSQCFGIISLYCAGEPTPNRDKAIRWLEKNQHVDGGFTWDVKDYSDKEDYLKVTSDVDMTASTLMAFSILKMDTNYPPVKRALEFLKNQQLDNGGFQSWGVQNPESTIWAIQALLMHGENPLDKAWEKTKDCGPVEFILKHQLENGTFTHVLDEKDMLPVYDNSMTTYEALYGMADAYNEETTYTKLYKANRPQSEKLLFSDFKEGDYGYNEAVEAAYDYVIDIYADGTFKPHKNVTKGELARYMVNALNLQDEFYSKYSGDELKFVNENSDVLEIDSEDNYIKLCLEKGIFQGIDSLDKEGEKEREIRSDELIPALLNGGKLINKNLEAEKLEFDSFISGETVSRAQCAVSLSKFMKLVK
ncbi:prenyltransferase and squalene oxidase repeat protein [Oxobacter pfennigii]|uniref:Prenyltransferase and squalene oxidase repeat protein n=1 Tax=Oxobacter pfennigii TaxID=36849 RepID=A0A0P8WYA3_9CLOT|nr:prenyltransferase/squalene oxidase repeat-containing protein [Oxobacter pfennigii]KPU43359.1 prenyltransferase and squalene oxidase repeat protein [Oxobacter pfennigii]